MCGQAATLCTPHYGVRFNSGPAVITFPSTAHPTDSCYFSNGTEAPCTRDCLVPAWSTPTWTLVDPANGGAWRGLTVVECAALIAGMLASAGTGGVALTFQGADVLPDDPRQCPSDPVTGIAQPAQWVLQLVCDATVPSTALKVSSAAETAPCIFTVVANTSAACGASVAAAL